MRCRINSLFAVAIVVLSGCLFHQNGSAPPTNIDYLLLRDPKVLALRAIERGDLRYLAVLMVGLNLPGLPDPEMDVQIENGNYITVKGISDTEPDDEKIESAIQFCRIYNTYILGHGHPRMPAKERRKRE